MQLFDLLDHSEVRQLNILQLLLNAPNPLSAVQIADHFKINRYTARDSATLLQENLKAYQQQIKLEITNGALILHHFGNVSLEEIYYSYLEKSAKYQILVYLLHHGKFELQLLADTLNISISTLTRRVKELNCYLAEFQLQIKNSQLNGSEAQIRHFYFQLYWFCRPYQLNQQEFADPSLDTLLDHLLTDKDLITAAGKLKIKLYLGITQQRLSYIPVNKQNDYFGFHLQPNAKLTRLQQSLCRYFAQKKSRFGPHEMGLFCAILIANYCLNVRNVAVQQFLNAVEPHYPLLHQLNTTIQSQMQHILQQYEFSDEFQQRVQLSLLQIHLKVIYFNGSIFTYGADSIKQGLSENGLFDSLKHLNAKQFWAACYHLAQTALRILKRPMTENSSFGVELVGRYAAIFHIAYRNINYDLKVGYDFSFEDMMTESAIRRIEQHLDPRIKIDIQPYAKNQTYDVIITNQTKQYPKNAATAVYVVLGIEYNFDFTTLNKFLKKVYQNKVAHLIKLAQSTAAKQKKP